MGVRHKSDFGSPVYNQIPPKMMVVSMTGFVEDPKQQAYKKMISDLKMRLHPVLSEQTSVLIVNDVSTEKYKIARKYETPISCVSIKWLLDCIDVGKILPTTKYHIRQLFYGVEVKIVGFQERESKKLQGKINSGGGRAVILEGNQELSEVHCLEERTSLILTNQANFGKLKHYLGHIRYPIVNVEWVEDSIRGGLCKYPFDYALNLPYLYHKEPIEHYKNMKKKLDLQLSTQPIDQFQPKILQHCFIYLAPSVNQELASLLKKLIMVYGGFYLQEISPNISHILTEPLTENEYLQFKSYGLLVHLVRVEWLIDAIYIHKRMKEEDYQIRSFRSKISSGSSLEERQASFMSLGFNSNSFQSIGMAGMSLPLNSRKSISAFKASQKSSGKGHGSSHHKHPKEVKVLRKYQSTIFKGYYFYVEGTQKKEIELYDLPEKILKNGGEVYASRANIHQGHFFYILKDSSEVNKLTQKLQNDLGKKVEPQPVSYRWINECLNKCQFIDLNKVDSYIYKPFNFKIPIASFHKMIFQVLGVDDVHKLRLKELYNNLGSARNMVNKSQITHCLCGNGYQETARYKELKKENLNVKYVSWKWLTHCANVGKIVDIGKYLMEKEGHHQLHHQNNQNQNQNNQNFDNIFQVEQAA